MSTHLPVVYYQASAKVRLECATEAAKSFPDTIKCKPKCSHCCNNKVYVTLAEAIEIVTYLKKHKLWEKVSKQLNNIDLDLGKLDPKVYYSIGKPCVLLRDDLCMAYPVRPIQCASLYVHSDPELCKPTTTHPGNVRVSQILLRQVDFIRNVQNIFKSESMFSRTAWLPFALKAAGVIVDHKYESFDDFIATIRSNFK